MEPPDTRKSGPIVIDAGAWTGTYEPTPEELAAAEQARDDYAMKTPHLAQSPLYGALALALFALITVFGTLVVAFLADAVSIAIVDVPLWQYIQQEAAPEMAGWLNYSLLILYVMLFLAAIYSCRGFFRGWLLPVWRGGFRGKPCLFATDEGFTDTRMLRDVVRWENIDDSEGAGITYASGDSGGKSDAVIKLCRPVRTLGGIDGGSTKNLYIHGLPFGRGCPPYKFLSAHYGLWRKRENLRREKYGRSDTRDD